MASAKRTAAFAALVPPPSAPALAAQHTDGYMTLKSASCGSGMLNVDFAVFALDCPPANFAKTSSVSEVIQTGLGGFLTMLVATHADVDLANSPSRRQPAPTMHLKTISDNDPALKHCNFLQAALLTLGYVATNGPIPLTPSKAFKRVFVNWAAAAFNWPGWTQADLFSVNKVLNEPDFPPLMVLHHVLVDLKLGRHYDGTFRLTKVGQSFVGKPGALFAVLIPWFLFNVDHNYYSRFDHEPFVDWDHAFDILNIEAENGVSMGEFANLLYGHDRRASELDWRAQGSTYSNILRPLVWAGFLREQPAERLRPMSEDTYMKTPLWYASIKLPSDKVVQRETRH